MHSAARRKNFVFALRQFAKGDTDYWSYKRMGQRPGLHGLIRYPAMMVPQKQSDVIEAAARTLPALKHVIDPFVGSGTTMLESIRRGFSFDGYDINPLAVLICRAKLLSVSHRVVRTRIHALLAAVAADHSKAVDVNFSGRDKWFTRQACIDLSRLRRAILSESNTQVRLFLWVLLAETIRQTSLSRETTYKLHIRPLAEQDEVERPQECFQRIAGQAIDRHLQHSSFNSVVPRARHQARLTCCDIRTAKLSSSRLAQLLITSPPYGDNESTIPYGQFSYLALKWISADDLEGDVELRQSAYAIDTASLGGSSRGYLERALEMVAISPSFRTFFQNLAKQRRPDLEAKAACFTADLFDAVGAALSQLEDEGLAVWTLGERRIGGVPVPLVDICSELNEFFGMTRVTEVRRQIQSKRMPHRNSRGSTMATETMLVMAKG